MDELLRVRLEVEGGDENTRDRNPESPHERVDEREERLQRYRAERARARVADGYTNAMGEPYDFDVIDPEEDLEKHIAEKNRKEHHRVESARRAEEKRRQALRNARAKQAESLISSQGGRGAQALTGFASQNAAAAADFIRPGLGGKLLRSPVVRAAGVAAAAYGVASGGANIAGTVDQMFFGGENETVEDLRQAFSAFEAWVRAQFQSTKESFNIRQSALLLGGDPNFLPFRDQLAAAKTAEGEFKAFVERREGGIRNRRAGEQLGGAMRGLSDFLLGDDQQIGVLPTTQAEREAYAKSLYELSRQGGAR